MEEWQPSSGPTDPGGRPPLRRLTTIVYALQAVGLFFTPALIAGAVINYVRRSEARGTWIEPHFRWQLRTFWFLLPAYLLGMLTWVFVIGYFILLAAGVWGIYRIVKGWLALSEEKSPYR